MTIWLNGELTTEGQIGAASAGVLLGWGVFTTIGIRNGQPLLLEKHFARLRRDAAVCSIELAFSDDEVHAGLIAVLEANEVQQGTARITLTQRGDGNWNHAAGSDVSILAHPTQPLKLEDLSLYLYPDPTIARHPLAGVKMTSYLPYLFAWQAAQRQGCDDALLCTPHDTLTETARASLFWRTGNEILTPSLRTGCLQGVGREALIEYTQKSNLKMLEGSFSLFSLKNCDAAFLISAATGPRSVTKIRYSDGTEKRISQQKAFFEELREWWDEL